MLTSWWNGCVNSELLAPPLHFGSFGIKGKSIFFVLSCVLNAFIYIISLYFSAVLWPPPFFFFFFEVVHFPYCYCFVWLNSCLGVTRLWINACIQSCQTGKPVFKLGVLNSKSRILFTLQWGFEKNFNNKQETILRNKHSTLHSPAVTLLKKNWCWLH